MKKTVRILSFVLAVVMLGALLASCAKKPTKDNWYSGPEDSTYWCDDTENMAFSGTKVTNNFFADGKVTSITGTFEMGEDENGEKTITFDFSESGRLTIYDGTFSFGEGVDESGRSYITLNGIYYYKRAE